MDQLTFGPLNNLLTMAFLTFIVEGEILILSHKTCTPCLLSRHVQSHFALDLSVHDKLPKRSLSMLLA